jgi:hypothetical protein
MRSAKRIDDETARNLKEQLKLKEFAVLAFYVIASLLALGAWLFMLGILAWHIVALIF